MEIIDKVSDLAEVFNRLHKTEQSIGMVPTMGALHEGHASLIKKARQEQDIVLVSIFVNPIQFGPNEDLESYPRDLKKDAVFCKELGVDYIFHPKEEEMYPEEFGTYVNPPETMTNVLCGASRPGHFRGVVTVLTKLFSMIRPHKAYFGEKDIQQLAIVKRMVMDLNLGVEIVGCPIVREEDGLAKSSRNSYLNKEERKAALVLRRSILLGLDAYKGGLESAKEIEKIIREEIEKEELAKIDYVEILDFHAFAKKERLEKDTLIAMAVYIGKTRLIDNCLI